MKPVVIYGNGAVAEKVWFFLTHDSPREVVAFTVDRAFMETDSLLGLPLVPFASVQVAYPPAAYDMIIGVGYGHVNRVRAEKYAQAKAQGYKLINYVSAKAITWPDLDIGDNCRIGAGSSINPFVRLGNNIIVGGGTNVGHHTIIMDHCAIAPRAVIAGKVIIEPYCLIGANATIRDRIRLASGTVVGAGAVILENTKEKGVYLGSPAELLPVSSDRLQLR